MDSHEKFAIDSCGGLLENELMKYVKPKDKLEVLVAFSKALFQDCVEYDDNYRIEPTTKDGIIRYNKMKNTGCCGFSDSAVTCSSGNTYLYGFNYGH